jgi:hypothetical protein
MSEEQKKAGAAWIAVLLIGLPVLYVASFGPACWVTSWTRGTGAQLLPRLYAPLLTPSDSRISKAREWYACAGAKAGWWWRWDESVTLDGLPKTTCEWQDGPRISEAELLLQPPLGVTFRDPEFIKSLREDSAPR